LVNNFAVLGLSFSGGHLAATFLSHDIYRQYSYVQHATYIAASMSFAIKVTPTEDRIKTVYIITTSNLQSKILNSCCDVWITLQLHRTMSWNYQLCVTRQLWYTTSDFQCV